jgi:hypothetical protein
VRDRNSDAWAVSDKPSDVMRTAHAVSSTRAEGG